MTPHFSLEELTITQHREIDNTPGEREMKNLEMLAAKMEEVRDILKKPILVSSGFRCLALNRAVGSKDGSAHVLGLACDFVCPSYGTVDEVFAALQHSRLEFDQLIVEKVGGKKWIHLGLREDKKAWRRMAFAING